MRIFVSLLAVLFSLPAAATDFTKADQEVERLMASGGVPGAAVVIVKDGQVVHLAAFGVTSVETGMPVTPSALFRLGSSAKMFTALAALRLVDEDKLQLDRPIGEMVTDLPQPLRTLTMEQLLTHTAGLAQEAPMIGPLDEAALHERVTKWDDKIFFTEPGEVFSYANNGYALAGDVIAQVAQQPFSEAIRTLVLDPMNMPVSTYRPLEAFTHTVALGHDRGPDGVTKVTRPFAEHAGNYPPGSLFTNAEELGQFLAGLTPATLARLATGSADIPAQHRKYGYGVITDENRGAPVVLHAGARSGYGSIIMFLPSRRAAVAILTNRTSAIFSSAAYLALEQFTGEPFQEATLPAGDLPMTTDEITSLVGIWTNSSLKVELAEDNGKLVLKLASRTMEIKRTGPWAFHIDNGRELENFVIVTDRSGSPRYLAAETLALRKRS